MDDFSDSVSAMGSFQKVVMIINIIICIALSVVLPISDIYLLCGKDVPCIDDGANPEETKERIEKVKSCWKYTLKIIQAPFIIAAFVLA